MQPHELAAKATQEWRDAGDSQIFLNHDAYEQGWLAGYDAGYAAGLKEGKPPAPCSSAFCGQPATTVVSSGKHDYPVCKSCHDELVAHFDRNNR